MAKIIEFKRNGVNKYFIPHKYDVDELADHSGRYAREEDYNALLSERMKCSGCGARPISAVIAVIKGKIACCLDCDTLTVDERNQIRDILAEFRGGGKDYNALLKRHRRLVELAENFIDSEQSAISGITIARAKCALQAALAEEVDDAMLLR